MTITFESLCEKPLSESTIRSILGDLSPAERNKILKSKPKGFSTLPTMAELKKHQATLRKLYPNHRIGGVVISEHRIVQIPEVGFFLAVVYPPFGDNQFPTILPYDLEMASNKDEAYQDMHEALFHQDGIIMDVPEFLGYEPSEEWARSQWNADSPMKIIEIIEE